MIPPRGCLPRRLSSSNQRVSSTQTQIDRRGVRHSPRGIVFCEASPTERRKETNKGSGEGINWYKIKGDLCPCVLHHHGSIRSLDLDSLKWPNDVFCFGFCFFPQWNQKSGNGVKSFQQCEFRVWVFFMLTLLTCSYLKTVIKSYEKP